MYLDASQHYTTVKKSEKELSYEFYIYFNMLLVNGAICLPCGNVHKLFYPDLSALSISMHGCVVCVDQRRIKLWWMKMQRKRDPLLRSRTNFSRKYHFPFLLVNLIPRIFVDFLTYLWKCLPTLVIIEVGFKIWLDLVSDESSWHSTYLMRLVQWAKKVEILFMQCVHVDHHCVCPLLLKVPRYKV